MIKSSCGILVLMFVGVGCSGGGSFYPKGKVCPSSYDPIPVNVTDKSVTKISLEPLDKSIPSGSYSYGGGHLYYQDAKGIKIHVSEARNPKTQELSKTIQCARGIQLDSKISPISISGLAGMEAFDSGKVTVTQVRGATLSFDNLTLNPSVFHEREATFESPKKVYEDVASEFAFYKMRVNDDKSFEVRSKIVRPDGSSISLQLFLHRADQTIKMYPPIYGAF